MVSDSDLVTRLRQILRSSDLDTATAATVRRQLEQEFEVDLSERKAFVTDQIDIFIQTFNKDLELERHNQNAAVQGDDEEEEGSDTEKAESKNVDKEVKKRRGGFNKLCSLSPELQTLCGVPKLARTEVVKKIWAYIRENSLQNPKNKRKIICDESLRAIFHVNSIDMFKMNKALTKHIWPLSAEDENLQSNEVLKGILSTMVDKDVKKRGGGFTKLCCLSPQLQTLVGVSELARTQVVKRLWIYIRENNLQDPKNKRNIICDESLHALFRVNSINMFKMNKALSRHIWPLDEEDVPAKPKPREKRCKQVGEGEIGSLKPTGADEPNQKEKRQKKGSSGFLTPLPLSDALVEFLGTGENALSRAAVVKRMWEYIKQNDLQVCLSCSWLTIAVIIVAPVIDSVSCLGLQKDRLGAGEWFGIVTVTVYCQLLTWTIILFDIFCLFLKDPSDRRIILCDNKLKELFEVDSFRGFSVAKLLTAHFVKM
ncbi:hypothetical protein EZV62_011385 [Acer yangbiense]|uniref:DM2 domain-containing protein n=1 Tax=Acer yangbiense TaxID=1000413 RepID=A0A5C7I579_9ROSI|nr:hypothetical protein EZV62_011385 [Acer yangbiense]